MFVKRGVLQIRSPTVQQAVMGVLREDPEFAEFARGPGAVRSFPLRHKIIGLYPSLGDRWDGESPCRKSGP